MYTYSGFYLNQARTASVVTKEGSVIYRMAWTSLNAMEENNPQTAAAFHRFMVRFLVRRLIGTGETMKALRE